MQRAGWHTVLGAVGLTALLVLCRCDTAAIDPFQESPFNYSVFGFLDVGVDTQFVRVTPVRDTIALAPGPIDAAVTLEHVASGKTTTLNDSLFLFRAGEGLRLERIAYNFWSDEILEPRATYRLTVTRSDGATSAATVTLPDTFPDPRIFGTTVEIRGVERLAAVEVIYWARDLILNEVLRHTVSYIQEVDTTEFGFQVLVKRSRDERVISLVAFGNPIRVENMKLAVAAAGPDFPDVTRLDEETLALPRAVSNIEDGVGLLGGIASKTLQWPGFVE